MRFKPRLDIERILDEVNKNNFGRADKSIIEKQLNKFETNLVQLNKSSDSENLDESMEQYLKYVYSQNRIAVMKMIQDKTLDKIVKQFKKEEKDQKIINDNFYNKQSFSEKKSPKSKKPKINHEENKIKNKSNKVNYIDKSCAREILSEFHTKTYFNATDIIAKNSKQTQLIENLKHLKSEENLLGKEINSNLKKQNFLSFLLTKKSSQDRLSADESLNILSKKSSEKSKPSTSYATKREFNRTASQKFGSNLNKKDFSERSNTDNNQEGTKNLKKNSTGKKMINQTRNNFFRGSKINLANFQGNNNIIENVMTKFKKSFNSDNDDNLIEEDNPLLYNMNFNNLRKKHLKGEHPEQEKLEYLKNLAFIENRKFDAKRFNILSRLNLEKLSILKKNEKEKEKEKDKEKERERDGNLDASDDDLVEINNELKNSSISNTGNNDNKNKNDNLSFNGDEILKKKVKEKEKEKEREKKNVLFASNSNLHALFSGDDKIKTEDLAKIVIDKCNFVKKKHKNNNTTHKSGNGKLMITSGLSINEFMKKFNLK